MSTFFAVVMYLQETSKVQSSVFVTSEDFWIKAQKVVEIILVCGRNQYYVQKDIRKEKD